MKISVKSAVCAAAQTLGIADGVEKYLNGEETEKGKRDTELLLQCFHHVENALALDFFPLIEEEEFDTSTGVLEYVDFGYPAVRVFSVVDEKGEDLQFKLFLNRLETKVGRIKVKYAYAPEEKDMDSDSDYEKRFQRVFVYGMAAEYSLVEGELEAANAWDKKYKAGITAMYQPPQGKRMKARRWV